MAVDVLADAVESLIAAGADGHLVRRVLSDVRKRWGGERIYLPKIDRSARNADICAAIERGEPPDAIADQVGVNPKTVRRRQSTWL